MWSESDKYEEDLYKNITKHLALRLSMDVIPQYKAAVEQIAKSNY